MTMLDGWVGEQVATDPSVLPVLDPVPAAVPVHHQEFASDQGPEEPDQDEGTSLIVKVSAAVLLLVVLAAGVTLVGPYLASSGEEPLPFSAPVDAKPTQHLVIEGDTLYLEGSVPDEEASRQFEETVASAIGADRVINNFQISPDAVFDPDQPVELTVAETVLFSTGRADVAAHYRPLIGLAVDLMGSHPESTLTVVGHTDDIGDEDTNLRLSMERAQATANALIGRGVEAERIAIEGRGEAEPLMPNDTVEGRTANRRVEFLINGLFG